MMGSSENVFSASLLAYAEAGAFAVNLNFNCISIVSAIT